ncbi:hypothetical protein PPN31114_00279 [Pandoraea pneumonica]|jgi:hypothetical protein|uniref:Phage-related membrane protein n=1 Tax=Pandoraea pneumonica TaxID=2508299 RepID=A0A5E4RMQ3_9BURK|nr:hypothetical protein [Pandoraea pneumonica]VVD64577.1 hypothetical protein PPN31114_00279 [Pandoraea pneumonica]
MKVTLQRIFCAGKHAACGVALGTAPFLARAESDVTEMAKSVSLDSTIGAILAIGITLATVYATLRGAKIVLSVLKGG